MANPEHLAILKQGVEEWNKWRREYPGVEPDLSGGWPALSFSIKNECGCPTLIARFWR